MQKQLIILVLLLSGLVMVDAFLGAIGAVLKLPGKLIHPSLAPGEVAKSLSGLFVDRLGDDAKEFKEPIQETSEDIVNTVVDLLG